MDVIGVIGLLGRGREGRGIVSTQKTLLLTPIWVLLYLSPFVIWALLSFEWVRWKTMPFIFYLAPRTFNRNQSFSVKSSLSLFLKRDVVTRVKNVQFYRNVFILNISLNELVGIWKKSWKNIILSPGVIFFVWPNFDFSAIFS